MTRLTDFIYRYMALPLLWLGARTASITNTKLRRRFREERSWQKTSLASTATAPHILFHASSMGEFEQLLPVIRLTRSLVPNVRIIASFFSPSGYAHGLRTPEVELCTYLPFDTKHNVRAYLDTLCPHVIVIDRYDVWRTFIVEAHARHIPVLLINATYPTSARGFLRAWFADTYRRLASISAVTIADARKLSELTRLPVSVLDDTRIDRVIEKCSVVDPAVEELRRPDETTIVIGSSWPADIDVAIQLLQHQEIRLVVVPHEPTPQALAAIQARISCTLLSAANVTTRGHIVVDSVGHLLGLYAIADAAIVGGGFGVGVHSVTEPGVYGMPIATGPNIHRSADAKRLHGLGLLSVVTDADQVLAWYKATVANRKVRLTVAEATRSAMIEHAGASMIHAERIAHFLVHDTKQTV